MVSEFDSLHGEIFHGLYFHVNSLTNELNRIELSEEVRIDMKIRTTLPSASFPFEEVLAIRQHRYLIIKNEKNVKIRFGCVQFINIYM